MTDRIRTASDVKFKPCGIGMSSTFRCNACNGFRSMYGRKLVQMRGLIRKQYVCAACAKP